MQSQPTSSAKPQAKYIQYMAQGDWGTIRYGVIEFLRGHRYLRNVTGIIGVSSAIVGPIWWAGFRPNFGRWTSGSYFSPVFIEMFIAAPLLYMWTLSGPDFELAFGKPPSASAATTAAETKAAETKKPEDALKADLTRLNEYYAINQSQARASFRWAIFAMFLGFTTIVAGIWVFYLRTAHPDKFMASLSTASGTVISLISGLFLNLYSKTQDRSVEYYHQLSQVQRIALAMRLVDEHQDLGERTLSRNEVIRQLLHGDSSNLTFPPNSR